MILIAEPVHFGDTHLQVNGAFIALLRHNFSDHKTTFVAEQKHIESLQTNCAEHIVGIDFYHFNQYSKNGRLYWFQKIWGEWKQILKVYKTARHQKPELLVWLCLFPTGHLFLRLLNKLSFSKQKQLIILHGEMEYFAKAQKMSEKILRWALKFAFKISDKSSNYIVLGNSIKANLGSFSFLPHERIFSLQHPFLYRSVKEEKESNTPLKVCTLGTLKKSKNAQLFFEMAKRFSKEIKDGHIVFNSIGKIFDDIKPYTNEWVSTFKSEQFLAQKEYENKIAEQDVALFFYDSLMYKLCASGALYEAINNRLPVISLQNDYFSDIANDNKSVQCVATLDEMEIQIRQILLDRTRVLNKYQSSIFSFIQQNSFLLQSQKLKAILEKVAVQH